MKVIVTDKMAIDGIDYLKEQGINVDIKFGISPDELLKIIHCYDGIIVRSATKITKEVIENGVNLKVAGRAGIGVDNIDVDYCTKKGITVVNTPEGNIMAAAEMTVALIFAMFRNIPQAYFAAKNNDFRRNKFVGIELDGKTAGIIGMGKIGSIVASKLKGCNMKVIAYDPYVTDDRLKQLGIERCKELSQLLKVSDVISLHIPKTAKSKNLIDDDELKLCKEGVRIANVARGGIINEEALYKYLENGHIAAAALDVLEVEPNFNKSPENQDYCNKLLDLENVIITPHLGASTKEANLNVSVDVAKRVEGVLKGEIVAAVNMPPINTDSIKELLPYTKIAEILGKIYYQAEKDTVEKIEIVYSGDIVGKETRVVSLSVLKGFLETIVDTKINYVNAELTAKNLGIEITESKSTNVGKYTNLITVKFTTKEKTLAVSGTVFAKEDIRIVDFFGYKLDFEPSTYIIAIQNIDRPGIIGKIGTIIGECDINIAAMQWSRNRRGEKAVSFVSVDTVVKPEVLNKLKEIKGVLKISRLTF
ncbi:MAG: phosphoglycerate dehydrogenase [Clostridiales bacterium]